MNQEIYDQYPVNKATRDINTIFPRCDIHYKYTCNVCRENIHFNGIAWCTDCKAFTCIHCSEPHIVKKKFFIFNYYYELKCHKCGNYIQTLDYAEYNMTHPYQIGDIRPSNVNIWINIGFKANVIKKNYSGAQYIRNLITSDKIEKVDDLKDLSPKDIWDINAERWGKDWPETGDFNHQYVILPIVYKFLELNTPSKILDVACGSGNVSRYLAKLGNEVAGVDLSSKMLGYAQSKELEFNMGIKYYQISADRLTEIFEINTFDKVVCNMALMDMDNLEKILIEINTVLKNNGIFVFSILHPCFSFPTMHTIKIPKDSERNEDKIWVLDNYFDTRPTLVYSKDFPAPLLYFPRTLSTYLNSIYKAGFIIEKTSEPIPDTDLVSRFPRQMYMEMDRRPVFMIFKLRKKLNIF